MNDPMPANVEHLEIACARSDRILPVLLGDVRDPSLQLSFVDGTANDIFWRALHEGAYDITEMSLAAHAILTSRGANPFIGLPVFTSRAFRHGTIFVRSDAGIEQPQDLAGRRIGIPEYQMTAAVWLRGLLQDEYGVAPETVIWYTGGVNRPGRRERIPLPAHVAVDVRPIAADAILDTMLIDGHIDAIMAPQIPASFSAGDERVRRLFGDHRAAEEAYFRRTCVFPIMHLLVLRRETANRSHTLAPRLTALFSKAKDITFRRLYDADALGVMAPWLVEDLERTIAIMGRDFWPYGIEANRATLAAFIRHLTAQGLLERPLSPEDLFR
jgi:4,5-dihydroxyphthalate decarboxylase